MREKTIDLIRIVTFTLLVLAALSWPGMLQAAETEVPGPVERQLARAFERGFGSGPPSISAPILAVGSRGRSTILTGQLGSERIELVCLLCDSGEVVAAARATGARLAARVGGAAPARLTLAGLEPNDVLLVDGLPGTVADSLVEPGEHLVVVSRGDELRSGTITLAPEQAVRLSVADLEPAPRARPWLRAGILLGGLGLAAAAVGATLLVLQDRCASARVDQDGHCAQLHDTGPLGWSFVGVGAATLVAGLVVALLREDSETAQSPASGADR